MRTTLLLSIVCLLCCFSGKAETTDLKQLEQQAIANENPTLFNRIANEYFEVKELSLAKKNAEKALLFATARGNALDLAQANELLGIISKERFDYSNAIEFLLLALDGWKKLDNQAGIAKVNLHIGQIFYFQKDYTNALIHLNRSQGGFETLPQTTDLADVYQSLGDVYLAQNFYGKAKNSYTTAFDLFVEQEAYQKAAEIARFLGKITLDLGDYEGALVYYSQSLDLHGSLEDLPNIATDYNDLALTHLAQRDFEEAKENNAIAYDLRSELKDTIGTAECLKNFGVIHAQIGNKKKAIPFLKKAAKLLEAVPVSAKVPALFEDISTTYSTVGDYEAALKYQQAFAKS